MSQPWNRQTAGLRALLEDLREPAPAPDDECVRMLEHLDLFVSDELDGVDVRARHPAMWRHLQVCAACRTEHNEFFDLLAAEMRGELLPAPARPAPPPAVEQSQPWRVAFEPQGAEQRPTLLFVFARSYLGQSLRPAAAAGNRATAPAGHDRLLLSYLGELAGGEVLVQIYARPLAADPTRCTIAIVAAGEPAPRAVQLTWGRQTFAPAALDADGAAELGPVPLADLTGGEPGPAAFALRLLA